MTVQPLAQTAFATGDVIAGAHGGTLLVYGSDGTPKGSLSTSSGSSEQTGMCFDGGGNLYTTNFGTQDMTKLNQLGQVITYPWGGSGFNGSPESCVVDNHQHVFVGSVDSGNIQEFNTAGTVLKTVSPVSEDRGFDWIELSGDQCTMLYTSEGSSIKAFDVCTETQLADFATGLPSPCFALRILKNGQVAVACQNEVDLLSQSGSVVSTYTTDSLGDSGGYLFAFNLTPDNSAFWTADYSSGDIFKVRLSDGAILTHIVGSGGISGLGVFGEGGPVGTPLRPSETYGGGGLSENNSHCHTKLPVDCATGNFWHSFTDLTVPGRGLALDLNRTYNEQSANEDGPFGHGWSSSYTSHLSVDSGSGDVTVVQENGSTSTFTPSGGGSFTAPPRVFATLVQNNDGTYTFTRRKREIFTFSSTGLLTAQRDLNGYTTTLSYDGSSQLTTVTDPVGRHLTFTHDANGHITSVTDPIGRTVSYAYSAGGDLTSVTDVGGGTTSFGYDGSHRMTTLTDPRGGTLTNTYDGSDRVVSQSDPLGRVTTFAYATTNNGTETTITSPKGNVTVQDYVAGELTTVTKGFGTLIAATWTYAYDQYTLGVIAATDPNGHVTQQSYDSDGNVTSVTDPLGRTTTTTYNGLDEPLTVTDPLAVATTYAYDANGNILTESRPVVSSSTSRTTIYHYDDSAHPGDVTSVTDPNGQVQRFTYSGQGDLTSSTDALGRKTTFGYDAIGRRTSSTSARGNLSGSNPALYMTTLTYDAFGDPTTVTDPLGHVTHYSYDRNRNRVGVVDPNGRATASTLDADNELTSIKRPDGTTVSYQYDSNGNQIGQTDAAGHISHYTYDALNRRISQIDPLNRTTSFGYDHAGNRVTLTDPSGRVTTYAYDADNELKRATYSDGKTPTVAYSYDALGRRTQMIDGSGTSAKSYDSLGRLTSSRNGAGITTRYGYDLVGHLTSLTYPGGHAVKRSFDQGGRLTSVSDWLRHTSKFQYDADGNLTLQTNPNGTRSIYGYDRADQLMSINIRNTHKSLASFVYSRRVTGQIASAKQVGSGPAKETYAYNSLNELTAVNSRHMTYDAADNLTKTQSGARQTFNVANALTNRGYHYDRQGNRTSGFGPTGAGATYAYNQANQLIRYHDGRNVTATYRYDGEGLRARKAVTAKGKTTTSTFTWDVSSSPALLLSDGSTRFIYGPTGLPMEQIDKSGKVLWFAHDQLGSTRLLTNKSGATAGTASYSAFGRAKTTGTVSHLDFAGEYSDAESGLVYLRARYFDPTTAQFLTVDPALFATNAPYLYALNNPLAMVDPLGLFSFHSFLKVVGVTAAVVGVAAAGTLLCISIVGCGAAAAVALGGATDLVGVLAFEEAVGTVAATVATVSTVAGLTATGGDALLTCESRGFSSQACGKAIQKFGVDGVFEVFGKGLFKSPVYDFLNSIRGLYSSLRSEPTC